MRLHYQRANPDTGGESFLLRFEGVCPDRIACLLVNSGRGVDVEDLLDESRGEFLTGIIINNAHPECYCTLGENVRDDVPIYATHETAQIVATALTGPHARSIDQPETVIDQMVVVDEWHQPMSGVQMHPLPVGHAPGAAGFLFEIVDGKRYRTLFIADEFTVRQAGGYSGVSLDLDVEIDAMILTDATDKPVASTLTQACSIICERANTGSTVLVTADEPTGLHVAGLLGRLNTLKESRSVTILGRIATLWEELGYTAPNVTIQPEDRFEALGPGSIAVATPTTPVQGLSGRLFEELTDDPDAMVVRLTHGEATPMSASRCMVQSLPWRNVPTQDTLSTVIDAFTPVQVVVADRNTATTEHGTPNCDSFVWCVDDDLVYTLFDGARWVAPSEVDPDTEHRIRSRASDRYEEPLLSEYEPSIPLPQYSEPDIAAEGIDGETIHEQIKEPEPSEQTATPMPPPAVPDTKPESSATDGGTTSISASLAALNEQLTTVQSIIDGRTHRASVVDAGDDVCLFRIQNPPASFEHGQKVNLLVTEDEEHGLNQRQEPQQQADTEHTDDGSDPDAESESSDAPTEAA